MYPIGVNSPRILCGSGDFLEILNYRINFLNTYRANYNIYFLLSLWYFVFIEKLVHFIYVVKFLYVELFTKISYSFDALGVCSDSFCFIHNIDNLCVLFCFVSLARDLVIFLIFSKIQIFIFFIVLFSISLVSDLNYISLFSLLWVYFVLLSLDSLSRSLDYYSLGLFLLSKIQRDKFSS